MLLDKRFIFAAVVALGFGMAACSDDDGDDNKKDNSVECTVNADCKDTAKPVCNTETKKCEAEKTVVDGKKENGDACEKADDCESGYCGDDKKCADKPATGDKGDKKDGGEACENSDECKSAYCDNGKCKAETPATCGNKALDEGEFCDKGANGLAIFSDETQATCEAFITASGKDVNKVDWNKENGKPNCSVDCFALSQGTCAVVELTCGDGVVADTEACETVDGKAMVSDGNGGMREATCADQNKTKFDGQETVGAPECNDKCNGMKQGTCKLKEDVKPVNGIASCTITKLEKSETGEVVAEADVVAEEATTEIIGAILCGTEDKKVGELVGNGNTTKVVADAANGKLSLTTNGISGNVYCIVVAQDKNAKDGSLDTGKIVVCSEDGSVSSANGGASIKDATNAKAFVSAAE